MANHNKYFVQVKPEKFSRHWKANTGYEWADQLYTIKTSPAPAIVQLALAIINDITTTHGQTLDIWLGPYISGYLRIMLINNTSTRRRTILAFSNNAVHINLPDFIMEEIPPFQDHFDYSDPNMLPELHKIITLISDNH